MVDKAYWQSPAVTAHANDVNKMLSFMAIGFFFYDLILSIPFDRKVISGQKSLKWVHFAYFGTKLSFLGFIGVLLSIFWAQTDLNCTAQFRILEFFMGTTVVTSSTLLAFRTLCVFQGKSKMIINCILGVLGLGMLAAWMQGVNDVSAFWDTSPGFAPYTEGRCHWTSVTNTYWVKYIVTILFDATVLGLTTVGIARMAGTSKLGMALIQQGFIYFFLTFLANLIIAIFTLLQLSPSMSLLVAVPQSAICVICSCRLHRELAESNTRRNEDNARALPPNDSISPQSGLSSLGKRFKVIERLAGTDAIIVQPLPYDRGTTSSFVSGTTANANSLKSPPILTPNAQDLEKGEGGYFSIARASNQIQQTPLPITNEISFADMLQESRVRQREEQQKFMDEVATPGL
jgi:hypothetical protein